jgi:hypothetical protein
MGNRLAGFRTETPANLSVNNRYSARDAMSSAREEFILTKAETWRAGRKRSARFFLLAAWLLAAAAASAQLAVSVSPVKVTGSKALVKLELKNTFAEKIESARAVCFLLDEQGKVVGQATQWVIGGALQAATGQRPPLGAGATNTFHFVIPTERATLTNLAARVSFTRVVLEGGKMVDVKQGVTVERAKK